MAVRDEVWIAVIERIIEDGKFRIGELDIDEGKRHTARRVLRFMESDEVQFLTRDHNRAQIWRAGPKAREDLNLSMRAQVLADE
ncbi:hypothetical protein ACFQMM_19365 [Saliphagus sp. GCM10025308]